MANSNPVSRQSEVRMTKAIEAKQWIDSVYNAMSYDERLGQLFYAARSFRQGTRACGSR